LSASAAAAVQSRGTPSTLNLDDIFGDCFFTPEGEAVFLSENPQMQQVQQAQQQQLNQQQIPQGSILGSGESTPAQIASRPTQTGYVNVPQAGGIVTTGLHKPKAAATVMGNSTAGAAPTQVPFAQAPQRPHHLQYAYVQAGGASAAPPAAAAKRGKSTAVAKATDAQSKADRSKLVKERNREHAKRSRIRKKFLLESLQQSVSLLKEENEKLKGAIRTHLGDKEADALLSKQALADAASTGGGLIATTAGDANKVLDDPDFSFIKALQTAQQNFVVTDPSLPDNPIVYATQGFLNLTGYTLDQVLGRNCRFLQGPETDPKAVEKIRNAIEDGSDMSVCLLNYRVDGTTFWNQFFIAALRDAGGNITNYVGVQCKVSDQYAASVCKKQEEADAAAAAAKESS
jgi:PAS domain S-box-containing protein